MGYVIEFRDESEYENTMHKLRKAKEALCEAWDMLDGQHYNERSYPKMSRHYRDDEDRSKRYDY